LGLGKSLTELGLRKFKKLRAWACPTKFSTPEQLIIRIFQSVPTDDNLNNLNGNDSGITSPVVVEYISTQSSLMLMMSRKTKRHQPQEH
jgi:hypothetical protein